MADERNRPTGDGSEPHDNPHTTPRPKRYEPHAHPMPAVSLNQVNDAQLRDALAHSSRSSRKALYEVAQAHGVETSTEQTQLLPVDEAGMPTVSIDDELVPEPMPGETTPESSEVAAAYPPSRPVPMTGMIPRVPNSQAAQRFGGVDPEPPEGYASPKSEPTTTLPTVHRGGGGR